MLMLIRLSNGLQALFGQKALVDHYNLAGNLFGTAPLNPQEDHVLSIHKSWKKGQKLDHVPFQDILSQIENPSINSLLTKEVKT